MDQQDRVASLTKRRRRMCFQTDNVFRDGKKASANVQGIEGKNGESFAPFLEGTLISLGDRKFSV